MNKLLHYPSVFHLAVCRFTSPPVAVGLLAGFIEGVNFFVSLRDGSSNFLFISGPVPTNSEDLVAITASRLLVSRLCLLELLVVAFDVIGIICE